MITISSVVQRIISEDAIAYEALDRGLLNINAYARNIHAEVEEKCKKEVKVNTIVTALSRLGKSSENRRSMTPTFSMNSLTVKLNLVELALKKGEKSTKVTNWLHNQPRKRDEFFLSIEGDKETDVIFSHSFLEGLKKEVDFTSDLNGEIHDLAAITLSYPSELTHIPNVGYTLMRALALKYINVVEVISSVSEITFLVDIEDVQISLEALKKFLKNPEV